ncbi:MAG: hypothetical protein PGN33_19080 [Methylobacterium radiotolerans]
MADAASARGDALRKLADASQPLYASLDQDQKRRAMILAPADGPDGRPRHAGRLAPGTAVTIAATITGRAATGR